MRSLALLLASSLTLVGCRTAAPGVAPPRNASDALAATCHAPPGETRPLLVEWPAADRAQLEAAASQGLVAVHFDGCQLEVLSRCELEGGYAYHGLTHKRDELRIHDRDALWAKIPLGAARLETALSREGQLNVDMVVVGQRRATTDQARATGNAAACSGATHVVTGMTVGAFSLYTGAAVQADAQVDVHAAGGGGEVRRETETLRRDGDLARCDDGSSDGPPAQCGALLRVELAPLGENGTFVTHSAAQRAEDEDKKRAELERAIRRWDGVRQGSRIGAGLLAAGAVGSLIFVGVRSIQISSADFDRERAEADAESTFSSDTEKARALQRADDLTNDIERFKDTRRTAGIVAGGLAVGAGALLGLAAGARHRSQSLERQARSLSVAPLAGSGVAGVSISGRF